MLRRLAQRLIDGAAGAVDRAATLAVESHASRQVDRRVLSRESRVALLERVIGEYPEPSLDFFGSAASIAPVARHVRSERNRQVLDVTWQSAYTPFSTPIAARYGAALENRFALARLFVRETPRPMAVLIHGYLTGHFALEERLWPIHEFDRRGFDTALFVLPFHGLRGRSPHRVPEFPGRDPRITNEGFRQAVNDLRGLVAWLRARGHARLGLLGMSLGGYTAALTATIEPGLDFLVPIVPLACLADFAREQGSLSSRPGQARTEHALLERAYRVVSPFSHAPRIDSERVLVVAARADRVTPLNHARRLSLHFRSKLVAFRGGHLVQLGRRAVFERVFDLLAKQV